MDASKFYINRSIFEPAIDIPIEIDWDTYGQEDSIRIFERNAAIEVIGTATDFEVDRFSHESYYGLLGSLTGAPPLNIVTNYFGECTDINYEFYFFSGSPLSLNSPLDWSNSYFSYLDQSGQTFSTSNLYYNNNVFSRSFFKLDFYDLPDEKAQIIYFTIILPTQQGATEKINLNQYVQNVDVKIPKMKLDFLGDKEGFFIYWLKNTSFISANTFYMSAKFFDAKNGIFIKMMNEPQSTLAVGGSQYSFSSEQYFYYKVVLNRLNLTYQVFDYSGTRRGINTNPIKWYQYVNP